MQFKYDPLYSSVSCNTLSLLMVITAHNRLFYPGLILKMAGNTGKEQTE